MTCIFIFGEITKISERIIGLCALLKSICLEPSGYASMTVQVCGDRTQNVFVFDVLQMEFRTTFRHIVTIISAVNV